MAWFYNGNGLDLTNELLGDWGLAIGGQANTGELFCHSNVKLESAAAFKGVKFRTAGTWGEILKEYYGASVVYLPGSEVYSAAERGVIDAFEYSGAGSNWPMGFHEITKYLGIPGIHSPGATHTIKVNRQSWSKLPADLQQILMVAIESLGNEFRTSLLINDSASIELYRDYGTNIFYVSDDFQAEIAKRTKEITEGYAADDPLFNEIWENKKAFVKTYKGGKTATTLNYSIYD